MNKQELALKKWEQRAKRPITALSKYAKQRLVELEFLEAPKDASKDAPEDAPEDASPREE